jgi:sialate O-acetylesterase
MKLNSVLLFTVCAAALAQDVHIDTGAVDDQVFQRDGNNRADIHLGGTAPNARHIEARLLRKHMPVEGFDWKRIGSVAGSKWTGNLAGLPAGGPYRIEVRAEGSPNVESINNILVGDLWVLAGQSNMEGVGDLVDAEMPHELVHNFDMSDHWLVAEEPLHTLAAATDPVHWREDENKQRHRYEGDRLRKYMAERKKGAGLGLPFAVEMVRRTAVPVGLLACAHGGTSMDQWDPSLKDKGGESLYGSMLRRFRLAGGNVKGVLWYQGESDANAKSAPEFQRKFERFVAMVREDFKQPELPFYYVQIGRFVSAGGESDWNLVQDGQRKAESTVPRSGMVASIDASLDDAIHVGTQDLKRVGVRLANLACHDLFPDVASCRDLKRGPRPVSAELQGQVVRVAFSDVNGRLRSTGRLSGFSIHSPDGAVLPLIFKSRLDPADPSAILLHISGKFPEGATLHYGYGKDPYCNVQDQAGMAVPVFGPLPIH